MAQELNPKAKEFKMPASAATKPAVSSATPSASSMGVVVDGTDQGAINKEYFIVEGHTQNYRTVLPHGHVTCNMYGQVANVSYTSRENKKIHSVVSGTDWSLIQADSAPIYNALYGFLYGSQ